MADSRAEGEERDVGAVVAEDALVVCSSFFGDLEDSDSDSAGG